MNSKSLFWLLASVFLTTSPLAGAQQAAKAPKIGVLVPASASGWSSRIKALQQGLRQLGYIDGQDIVIEYRYTDGKADRLAEFAAELIRLKVSVIVTATQGPVRVIQKVSSTIPIVFATIGSDPVEIGLVASLAKPGGNVTGLTLFADELNGKRLELIKEASPKVSRVAFLWNADSLSGEQHFKEADAVAKPLGLVLQSISVKGVNDFERAFEAAKNAGAHALTTTPNPLFSSHTGRIADLATKNRLPGMYSAIDYVEAGGLMSYGPDLLDNWRRAAIYVDKILKGRTPADLPVEQPMKFEFIINLKAAKQIGVTIPPNVLVRADKVIR
ncbi:MAG TPA: ABC transporter substrate-binding protein [Pyrinomonadaceae bacterium]|nr:ABC transporter substrate-binding protein [Pyrinomonadaceae bacterium]